MTHHLNERVDGEIRSVSFAGKIVDGTVWRTSFINCDFSGADLSSLYFVDVNIFRNCIVDKLTIPPMTNHGTVYPGFQIVIDRAQPTSEIKKELYKTDITECLINVILGYLQSTFNSTHYS